jgi:2'-5' RNA ligase
MSNINTLTHTLGEQLKKNHVQLSVAESCTGGSLAAALTAISGSSHWFDRGFVTYSNQAKKELLGVTEQTLHTDGAVSEATVRAMAEGAIFQSDAHLSVAISGIAGPDGGTHTKPVGTVWIAFSGLRQPTKAICYTFKGDRAKIRETAVLEALKGLIKRVKAHQMAAPAEDAAQYFLALWPDETTKNTLDQHVQIITKETPCKPSLAENLHLTLAYLGTLTIEECATIQKFNCAVAPFELNLTKACHWSEQKLAYFSPESSKPLTQLHAFLNQYLLSQGFKPERREFKPHITLARDYTHALETCVLQPMHWFIHELCLVQSIPYPSTSQYQIIKRTPLTLKTC